MSITHEKDIPGIASQPLAITHEQCWTELSFCLPTSMAFTKHLTWEQTPWVPALCEGQAANPISKVDSHIIREHIHTYLDRKVSAKAIRNALMLGSTYTSAPMDRPLGVHPLLFVIFPNIRQPIAHIPEFLKVWHDQIVKPAFDTAWADSGLTPVYRGDLGESWSGMLASRSQTCDQRTYTEHDADRASRILNRLELGYMEPLRTYWPSWTDKEPSFAQLEGPHSAIRANIYNEAWNMILGMLKDHPDLPGFQNPILLATCRGRLDVNPELSAQHKWSMVGHQWDKYVDSRFMVKGSLKVIYQNEIGEDKSGLKGVEEARIKSVNITTGSAKRVADPEQDDPLEETSAKKKKQARFLAPESNRAMKESLAKGKGKGKARVEEEHEFVDMLLG